MRLTLELIQGSGSGTTRIVDGTRAFSVGTAPGANWVLPGASQTGGRIVLRSTPQGYVLEGDGHVTLEGQPVGDGMQRGVGHGSRIGIGDFVLRAMLVQDQRAADSGFSILSAPTISAILSDVTPGGQTARGPLPGRTGEEWLDALSLDTRPAPGKDWATLGLFGSEGTDPPLPAPDRPSPLSTFLPDDWDTPRNPQNQTTQSRAPSGSLAILPLRDRPQDAPAAGSLPDPAVRAFIRAAGLLPDDLSGPVERQMEMLGHILRALLDGVARIEAAQARAASEIMEQDGHSPAGSAGLMEAAMLLAGDQPQRAALYVTQYLDRLAGWPPAVIEAARGCLAEARAALDPAVIAAGVASGGGLRARTAPAGAAWAAYRRRWNVPDGPPLSDAALAKRLRDLLNENPKPEPDL